jgi:hypothetical protein
MKKNVHSVRVAALLAPLVLLAAGCEYKVPKSVWDPNADLGAQPTITSMDPSGRASGGAQTISIQGSGFSADPSKCSVFFGGVAAEIISAADNQIVVQRPKVTGDSITIKVLVTGTYTIASFPGYAVDPVYRLYGFKALAALIQWIAVDADENLYGIKVTKDILRILPNETSASYGTYTLKQKCAGIRIGPDGALYSVGVGSNAFQQIPPEGGNSVKYADLPAPARCFDFDAQGTAVFLGDNTGLFLLLPDLSTRTLSVFNDLKPVGLRCYKGQVFAYTAQAIWKTTLTADYSSAGPKEKVFDISEVADYAGSSITSFVMDEHDGLVVSTSQAGGNPLLQVSADGAVSIYYKGILPDYASGQLAWGSGHFLYLNMQAVSSNKDVLRIDAGMNEAGK